MFLHFLSNILAVRLTFPCSLGLAGKLSQGGAYLKMRVNSSVHGICLIGVGTCFFTGDVILLGKTNMLRFNHPQEAAKLRKKRYVSCIYGSSAEYEVIR